MAELEHAGFAKGFAWGLGYGGYDMVKSTGETIVGVAKFAGRGVMQVGLRFTWAMNWVTGQDNTVVNEWITEVDAAQGKVVGEALEVGKFLGTLLLDTAAYLPKIELALLSGDMDQIKSALQGSETHRKIFDMAAEVITETMEDLETGTPGQKGYVIGKIVFEVVSAIIPATKLGKVMQVTKGEILGKLVNKTGLLKPKAHAKAGLVKAAVDASQMCFVAGTPVLTKSGLMKIESVHAGTVVWARDEFTQQEGWKRVLRTFVTHPTELHRLTYELRGPPSCETGCQPVGTGSETLGVTAPHPFWVVNREQPAFIEAEKLQAGDELLTADGRSAVVTGKVLEVAPAGETFTTFNFEVEDYHTYFAGRSAVWVHNHLNPGMPACMRARAGIRSLSENGHNTWDAFKGELALFSHADLSSRARLRVFNEVRKEYLAGNWTGGTPPWDATLRHTQTIGAKADGGTLGRNMKKVGVDAPWKDGSPMVQAHHIVPGGDKRYQSAIDARKILDDAGIDINEAANGCFLPNRAEFSDMGKAIHNGSPPDPKKYSDWVYNRLEPLAGNPAALRLKLQKLANDLVEVGWP